MGRYKTKIQSITEANQRILKEQFHVKSDEFENYYINSGIPIDKIEDNYYILGPINGHEMNIKFTDDGYYVVKPSYYGGYYEESPRSFEDVNSLIDYINNFNYDSHPDPKGAGAYHRRLNEQEGLPGKTIFQIKFSEDWGKGTDNKGELFFEDYDKAIDYLTSNGYEYKDYPIPTDYEYWEKDYGNHARLYRQQLIV